MKCSPLIRMVLVSPYYKSFSIIPEPRYTLPSLWVTHYFPAFCVLTISVLSSRQRQAILVD